MSNQIRLTSNNTAKTKDFYSKLMPMIGYNIMFRGDYLSEINASTVVFAIDNPNISQTGQSINFRMQSMQEVISFYIIAVGLGAKNQKMPHLMELCSSTRYYTFITDPDGNNLEAVCDLTAS